MLNVFAKLNFQEDFSSPEQPVWEEAKGGERNGKGEGCEFGGVVAGEDMEVGPLPG